jgi:hypothetical protein
MNVGGIPAVITFAVAALLCGGLAGCDGNSNKPASNSTTAIASGSAAQEQDAVLRQEARWLTAITDGDRNTIEAILSPTFKHITSDGKLLDRAQEIANTVKEPFAMNPTEQTVDFAGAAAVVHGVNTVTQSGNVLARERFTDVFVNQDGNWMALSAQETAF